MRPAVGPRSDAPQVAFGIAAHVEPATGPVVLNLELYPRPADAARLL